MTLWFAICLGFCAPQAAPAEALLPLLEYLGSVAEDEAEWERIKPAIVGPAAAQANEPEGDPLELVETTPPATVVSHVNGSAIRPVDCKEALSC